MTPATTKFTYIFTYSGQYFCQTLTKFRFSHRFSLKSPIPICMGIHPVGTKLMNNEGTHGQTWWR